MQVAAEQELAWAMVALLVAILIVIWSDWFRTHIDQLIDTMEQKQIKRKEERTQKLREKNGH